MSGYLVHWSLGNVVSMFTKLPVYDSIYRGATLPKPIRPRMEMMTETANELNLVWRQMAMIMRHFIVKVMGSIHTLYIVVESFLFPVQINASLLWIIKLDNIVTSHFLLHWLCLHCVSLERRHRKAFMFALFDLLCNSALFLGFVLHLRSDVV